MLAGLPSRSDHPRAVSGCRCRLRRLLNLLAVFMIFDQLGDVADARPIQPQLQKLANFTNGVRWINPCDLPATMQELTQGTRGATAIDIESVANGCKVRARIAYKQAQTLLNTFVEHSFRDSSVVEGTASHRLSWLPKVTREELKGKSVSYLVRYFYSVLQYYGVALEQVILDMTMYDSTLLPLCQEAENLLTQTLCQLHLATFMLRIRLNPDVTRDVMQQEYRSGTHSQRTLRNYMIFRDYAEVLSIMIEAFEEPGQRTFLTTPLYNMFFDNDNV